MNMLKTFDEMTAEQQLAYRMGWDAALRDTDQMVAALQEEGVGEVHQVSIGDDGELSVSPVLLLDEGESYLVVCIDGEET